MLLLHRRWDATVGAAGFIMGHAGLNDLSGQLLAAASAAVPLADAGVRALGQSIEGRKKAERNDFYFLYAADHSQR